MDGPFCSTCVEWYRWYTGDIRHSLYRSTIRPCRYQCSLLSGRRHWIEQGQRRGLWSGTGKFCWEAKPEDKIVFTGCGVNVVIDLTVAGLPCKDEIASMTATFTTNIPPARFTVLEQPWRTTSALCPAEGRGIWSSPSTQRADSPPDVFLKESKTQSKGRLDGSLRPSRCRAGRPGSANHGYRWVPLGRT